MSSPTGFIPYDTQSVKYVTSIPSNPNPDFVYMLWDGVDSSKAVRYEFSDGKLQGDGVVETTLANLGSAQSAGVGAVHVISDKNNAAIEEENGLWKPKGRKDITGVIGHHRIFSYQGSSSSAGYTVVWQQPSKKKYIGFYLVYENYTASAMTLTAVTGCASPTHQSDLTGLTLKSYTPYFDTLIVPAGTGSGNDIVPGVLVSNFIPDSSVERIDGGTCYLHQFRTYCAGAWSKGAVVGGALATFNAWSGSNGLQFASRNPVGDLTTTVGSSTANPMDIGGSVSPNGVIFVYEDKSTSLVCVGDSLVKGHLATIDGLSWPYIAARDASTSSREVTCFNHAWTGQTHDTSIKIGKALINAGMRPTFLAFTGFSGNDATQGNYIQSVWDTDYIRTSDMVEFCKKNNVIPIIINRAASNYFTATENTRRIAHNARLQNLVPPMQYIDVDSVITASDGTTIKPEHLGSDGSHYNDAGYTAIGVMAAKQLKVLMSTN